MKKIIYILVFAFVSAMSVTACTEEELAPKPTPSNGGGNGSTDGAL